MVVFQKVAGILVVLFAIFTLQSGLACLGLLEAWCSPRSQAQNSSDKDQVDCDNDASSVEDRVQKIFLGYQAFCFELI